MVDHPDWGAGGESRSLVPASNGAAVQPAFDGNAYIADLERRHNGTLPAIGPQAQSTLQTGTGLNHELVREMSSTADGFAANVSLLKESATRLLDEFGQSAAVEEHFESLSPSIQTKVFRELWLHPGISFLDLLDVVEPTLTLSEAHEAERWLRKLRGL